jgi:tetratricopeptide (TPR) repeat protein
MVGRNETCPCGSGQKYKKCCFLKVSVEARHFATTSNSIPGKFMSSNDPRLAPIKKMILENYYFEQKNPYFLYEIGTSLGLIGFSEDALWYCKRALKFAPKRDQHFKNLLLTNLGQMYSDVGDVERGLNELARVPDSFPRKKLIEANIRLKTESFENLIEHYRFAIKQEPDFFLPYEYLITRLEITDPKREYLVNSSVKNMPNSPIAALYWADQELFNKNFSALADVRWINKIEDFDLDTAKERDIINFSIELPMIMRTLHAIHDLAKLMDLAYTGSKSVYANQPNYEKIHISIETAISNILPDLRKVKAEFRCNLSKRLMDCFATYGKIDELKVAHAALCDNCKEHIDFEQVLFSCHYTALKVRQLERGNLRPLVDDAIILSENVLKGDGIIRATFINNVLDFFDDWVSTERVLDLAEVIFDLDASRIERFDLLEDIRLKWNLGIMAGKLNNWSLAERFITQALSVSLNNFRNEPVQRYEKTDHDLRQRTLQNYLEIRSHGEANLAISCLGQRKLTEAREILEKLQNGKYEYLPKQQFIEELSQLIDWVDVRSDFSNFKNEFRARLAQTSFAVFYGERPITTSPKYSLSEAIVRANSGGA